MSVEVVFIQGGGAGAHAADAPLAASLLDHLGAGFRMRYPRMPHEDEPDADAWMLTIREAIDAAFPPVVLVGHSIGGYLLLKTLASRESPSVPIAAVCVVAAPFPSADAAWTFEGFELPGDLGARLPTAPVFLYHSEDDEEIPFAHQRRYAEAIPHAVPRITTGGHQLGADLHLVAGEIAAVISPGR